jgi:FlaA1/EpsC-like NDP-sugar epimerase
LYEYNLKEIRSKFSIVRFGNVLESSGSVIPKFKKQIEKGGPITLTHPDVTRYFMTTTEAAQLVIQAGAMSENCEVFVLDMGESVKIKDLVYKMIKLSGFTVKDNENLDGDIEVKIIGLRPGEKLYEELLIGNNPEKTSHEKIKKAQDTTIPFKELDLELKNLEILLNENNISGVKNFLKKIVKSYKSNSNIIDHLYLENLSFENQENKVINIKQKT